MIGQKQQLLFPCKMVVDVLKKMAEFGKLRQLAIFWM
jgi:hypothetical protein